MSYTTFLQNPLYYVTILLVWHIRKHWVKPLSHRSNTSLEYSENSTQPVTSEKSMDSPITLSSNNVVSRFFIDAISEDQPLVEKLTHYLDEHDYRNYLLPVDFGSGRYSEVLERLKSNLLECSAVILISGDEVPISWLENRLRLYRKVQSQRSVPLKINIYCSENHSPHLDFPNLSVCHTPENCVEFSNAKS